MKLILHTFPLACTLVFATPLAAQAPPAASGVPATPGTPPTAGAPGQAIPVAATANMATVQIDSNVPGADIEIDGAFAGNTPSTLTIPAGQHTITVKKKNYPDWTRTMNVSGSNVHLNATLQAQP